MTVALVWTLLVWSPVNGGYSVAAVEGFPTEPHCRATANLIKLQHPGFRTPKTVCIQRQIVVASK